MHVWCAITVIRVLKPLLLVSRSPERPKDVGFGVEPSRHSVVASPRPYYPRILCRCSWGNVPHQFVKRLSERSMLKQPLSCGSGAELAVSGGAGLWVRDSDSGSSAVIACLFCLTGRRSREDKG